MLHVKKLLKPRFFQVWFWLLLMRTSKELFPAGLVDITQSRSEMVANGKRQPDWCWLWVITNSFYNYTNLFKLYITSPAHHPTQVHALSDKLKLARIRLVLYIDRHRAWQFAGPRKQLKFGVFFLLPWVYFKSCKQRNPHVMDVTVHQNSFESNIALPAWVPREGPIHVKVPLWSNFRYPFFLYFRTQKVFPG